MGHLEHDAGRIPVRFTITQGRFGDILAASQVVIGLSGTANEQAVGLGKPVVTFVGRGSQFTEKFVRTQKKLLGEAISVVAREPRSVAREVLSLITDETRREAMAMEGRKRMGQPGGARRIALEISRLVRSNLPPGRSLE